MTQADYEKLRTSFKPEWIKWLFIAESSPPADDRISTRYFYRADTGAGDRLFVNTIRALYAEAAALPESALADNKSKWLDRFRQDGCYMTEALTASIPPGSKTSSQRQALIKQNLPELISRVKSLASPDTKIILIKSNVFVAAAEPLRAAGFNVLNQALLDYPGRWREEPYRQKLAQMVQKSGWPS